MMNDLIMLTGLPGCGKSTFRKPYKHILSTDDWIESNARATGQTYKEVFESLAPTAEKNMYEMMNAYIQIRSETIVWDQTNLNAKTRMKKLKAFNAAGGDFYRKISVFFEPNLNLSIIRQEERRKYGRAVPLHIVESMARTIEVPTKQEGFDYILVVPVSSQE